MALIDLFCRQRSVFLRRRVLKKTEVGSQSCLGRAKCVSWLMGSDIWLTLTWIQSQMRLFICLSVCPSVPLSLSFLLSVSDVWIYRDTAFTCFLDWWRPDIRLVLSPTISFSTVTSLSLTDRASATHKTTRESRSPTWPSKVTQGHQKRHISIECIIKFSYYHSIETIVLSCLLSHM